MNSNLESLIDFTNPGHIKLALLSEGIGEVSDRVFGSPLYAENQFPYGYSSEQIRKYKKTPAEIVLPNDVYCGIHLRNSSSWRIELKNSCLELQYKNKSVVPISFIPRPNFYGKMLSNGRLCEKVAVLYGSKYILSFFTRGYCHYFSINKQCKFCSLNPTRKTLGRGNVLFITPEIAKEAAKLAFKSYDKILYVNHCAGTHKDNNLGLKFQIDVLKAIMKIVPKGIKQHMLTMPPDDLDLLSDLKEAGLDTVNFAIEVFDPQHFAKICEGKDTFYGRGKLFAAFKKAIKGFGEGCVYCNFVGGLESIKTMTEGFEYLASLGVVPSVNVFHPDPESKFHARKAPDIKYLLDMVKAQAKVYRENDFIPIFQKGGTRNSLDTEVYRGFFD